VGGTASVVAGSAAAAGAGGGAGAPGAAILLLVAALLVPVWFVGLRRATHSPGSLALVLRLERPG